MSSDIVLYCDGASRGNPGPAAFGYILIQKEEILFQEGKRIGETTNNTAEYLGLINGLKKAIELGILDLIVKSDSELMVRQLNGIYKVKTPHIQELFSEVKKLSSQFNKIAFLHVRREENKLADSLCNQALDRR